MRLPLEGIRVTELSQYWAGPFAAQYLAYLGAEVIKVEPTGRGDGLRAQGGARGKFWEWTPVFNGTNVNKYGVTLDLGTPEGMKILRQLISISDVVVENFSTRVVGNLGIDADFVRRANPTAILLSLPGFGRDGPWGHYVGFGPQFEEGAGITYISGYPDSAPISHAAMADPLGGLFAAIALLVALEHRSRTGVGQYAELSIAESASLLNAHTVLDYTMNGRVRQRNANKHLAWAPHGAFPCKGDDEWVAIAVQDDEQFRALCEAMGAPGLAQDPRFADMLSRWRNEDALREHISRWTRGLTNRKVMERLQRRGVPAGAATTQANVIHDPHLKARDFFQWVQRPVNGGKHPYYGFPARFSRTPVTVRKATPTLGEDNDFVYGAVLGLPSAEIADLSARGIAGRDVRVG